MRTAKAQVSLRIRAVYQGFHCPLTESLDTTESKGPDDTLRMRRMIIFDLRMFEDTFSL